MDAMIGVPIHKCLTDESKAHKSICVGLSSYAIELRIKRKCMKIALGIGFA